MYCITEIPAWFLKAVVQVEQYNIHIDNSPNCHPLASYINVIYLGSCPTCDEVPVVGVQAGQGYPGAAPGQYTSPAHQGDHWTESRLYEPGNQQVLKAKLNPDIFWKIVFDKNIFFVNGHGEYF